MLLQYFKTMQKNSGVAGFEPLTFLQSVLLFKGHSPTAMKPLCNMLLDSIFNITITDINLFSIEYYAYDNLN